MISLIADCEYDNNNDLNIEGEVDDEDREGEGEIVEEKEEKKEIKSSEKSLRIKLEGVLRREEKSQWKSNFKLSRWENKVLKSD